MADELPVTLESIVGLTIAIEVLQEVLFANRLIEPAQLAKKYDEVAQQHFEADRSEIASVLETLITRLEDPDRKAHRLLVRARPQGSA